MIVLRELHAANCAGVPVSAHAEQEKRYKGWQGRMVRAGDFFPGSKTVIRLGTCTAEGEEYVGMCASTVKEVP